MRERYSVVKQLGFMVIAVLTCACGVQEEVALPSPQTLTADAEGYYCGMTVGNHAGPKAQIHLKGIPEPLWFVSVRGRHCVYPVA